MTGSKIHSTLVALTALWRGLGITGLQVEDGPVYDTGIHFLAVGWLREDEPAVMRTGDIGNLGANSTDETFDVSCLLSMWSGDSNIPTTRGAAFSILTQLETALEADVTLGGLVDNAWITTDDYTPDQGEAGDQVDLGFTVHVEAY